MRRAVARARLDVATWPRTSTAAPQPARTHQAARLASSKLRCPVVVTEAGDQRAYHGNSRVWPTWRAELVMARAAPALGPGMPETAALVIGGFTRPYPMPKIT